MATYTTTISTAPSSSSPSTYELASPFKQTNMETDSQRKLRMEDLGDARETEAPANAVDVKQRWNGSTTNMLRVFATFWSFLIVGMNDGSYGALVPYLERYYNLTYTVVSLIFLSPFLGYTLAAFTNNNVHIKFGQRGVAVMGPLCHLVSFVVMALHPPYPVLIVMFMFVGFGNGLIDAAWCAWIGNMANANEVSGVLQAFYALGATVAPLISTTMFTKGGLEWYYFYYIMLSGAAVELLTSAYFFWGSTGEVYRNENPPDPGSKTGGTREAMKSKVTWIFAVFIFGYMGAEISLGGWIVVFMMRVRDAPSFDSGMTATGFWAGMTVGRLTLSFLTSRLGEFTSVLIYLSISLALELIFWLVPNFIVSAVSVAFLGFFFGPLFPTAIILVTKLLPRHLHVPSIGFGTAIGGSGGAIFPFAVGAIAQAKGVQTLQPIILGILVVIAGCWLMFTPFVRRARKGEEGELEVELETRRAS